MLWSLLILVIVGGLSFDLNTAWIYYRNSRSRAKGGLPFIKWWAKKSKVKIGVAISIILTLSLTTLFQGHTLVIPEIVTRPTTSRRVQWGLGAFLFMVAFVIFDLFMTIRANKRNSKSSRTKGLRFYKWWLKNSALKFSIAGGVACLILGGAWTLRHYNNSLQLKSETSGYMASAQQYYKEKKFREATLELRNAIKQNPGDHEAYVWLARSQWQMGSAPDARDAYREAIRIAPNLYPAHLELGRLAFAMKDASTTLTEAKEAARLEPNQVEPRLLMAQILSATGKREQALEQCKAIISAEFAVPESRLQLITLLLRQRALPEALQATETGLKKNPHDLPLRYMQAEALEALGRSGEAESVLRAIAGETSSADPYLALGDIKMRNRDYIAALNEYGEALKRAPDNDRAMNNFASLNAEHGFDMERSAALAARLYNKHPKDPSIADTLGWTLFRQGKLDLALPLLQQGASGMSNNPIHHYHLGAALLKSGKPDAGRQQLAVALKISGTFDGAAQAREMLKGKGKG